MRYSPAVGETRTIDQVLHRALGVQDTVSFASVVL